MPQVPALPLVSEESSSDARDASPAPASEPSTGSPSRSPSRRALQPGLKSFREPHKSAAAPEADSPTKAAAGEAAEDVPVGAITRATFTRMASRRNLLSGKGGSLPQSPRGAGAEGILSPRQARQGSSEREQLNQGNKTPSRESSSQIAGVEKVCLCVL